MLPFTFVSVENVEKSFVLKTNGWNLQYMIEVAIPFNIFSRDYVPLPLGYLHV